MENKTDSKIEKYAEVAKALSGITKTQWEEIKHIIDRLYDYKACKLISDSPDEILESIKFHMML